MTIEFFLSLFTALGVGGILGAYSQSKFQQKREWKNEENKNKKKRYEAIIIQMLTVLDFEKNIKFTRKIRPDLESVEDYINEIKMELLNSFAFASDEVILNISEFLKLKDYKSYAQAVFSIRKDLWGKRTNIKEKIITDLIKQ